MFDGMTEYMIVISYDDGTEDTFTHYAKTEVDASIVAFSFRKLNPYEDKKVTNVTVRRAEHVNRG